MAEPTAFTIFGVASLPSGAPSLDLLLPGVCLTHLLDVTVSLIHLSAKLMAPRPGNPPSSQYVRVLGRVQAFLNGMSAS